MKIKNNQSGSMVYLVLVLIILAAITVVGVYVYKNKQTNKKTETTNNTKAIVNPGSLNITEWGVKGELSSIYPDVKYIVPSVINYGANSASFSSTSFTTAFKASGCGETCSKDPYPFVILRSQTAPDADVSGNKMTKSDIDLAVKNKSLVVINDWYYTLPNSGPTYSTDDLPCIADPTVTKGKATCTLLDAYTAAMKSYFISLQKI